MRCSIENGERLREDLDYVPWRDDPNWYIDGSGAKGSANEIFVRFNKTHVDAVAKLKKELSDAWHDCDYFNFAILISTAVLMIDGKVYSTGNGEYAGECWLTEQIAKETTIGGDPWNTIDVLLEYYIEDLERYHLRIDTEAL